VGVLKLDQRTRQLWKRGAIEVDRRQRRHYAEKKKNVEGDHVVSKKLSKNVKFLCC
jgi:hypothetical protein